MGQAQQMDQTQQLDAMPPRTTFIYIGG